MALLDPSERSVRTRFAAFAIVFCLLAALGGAGCCDDDDDDDDDGPHGTVLFEFHENYNFDCCETDSDTFAVPTGDTNVFVEVENFYYGDIQVEISGAHSMCSPLLMKGSSLTCIAWNTSFTPMNARMKAMP